MSLDRAFRRFVVETVKIRDAYVGGRNSGTGIDCARCHPYAREMAVVRLHDAWARFCRRLVLESAGGGPITLSGRRLPRVLTSTDAALTSARALHPRKFEPRWGDPTICLRVARRLSVPNYSEISAGVGITPSPVEDIANVRNHLVHRNVNTNEIGKLRRSMGLPQSGAALEVIDEIVAPQTPLLALWVGELHVMAQIAAS